MQDLIQPYLSSIGELRTIRDLKEYDTHFNVILGDFRKLTIPKSALITLHKAAQQVEQTAEDIAAAAGTVANFVETVLEEVTPALPPLPLGEGQGEGSPAPTTTNDGAEEQPAANSQPPTAKKRK